MAFRAFRAPMGPPRHRVRRVVWMPGWAAATPRPHYVGGALHTSSLASIMHDVPEIYADDAPRHYRAILY